MNPTAALYRVLAATAGAPTNFQNQFHFAFTPKDGVGVVLVIIASALFFVLRDIVRGGRRLARRG